MMRIETIDAQAGGAGLRLITAGVPSLAGRTMREKLRSARTRVEPVRRAILLEPRGHAGLTGAVLTEPCTPEADAGVLFMHAGGFTPFCGHGVMAVATIAIERGLIHPREGSRLALDTCRGVVSARIDGEDQGGRRRVRSVRYTGPPVFVHQPGAPVRLGPRTVRADVVWAAEWLAVIDGEAAGVPLTMAALADLSRAGHELARAVSRSVKLEVPGEDASPGIQGVVFTGPAGESGADLRVVVVYEDGVVDRSPSGTGTAAVCAVVNAMGMLAPTGTLTVEGLAGERFTATVAGQVSVGDRQAVEIEVGGSAWVTGEHVFLVDPEDPSREGYPWGVAW